MKTKPWPIILLAIWYFLGPVYNTWSGARLLNVPYFQYIAAILTQAPMKSLVLLSLYPIAGAAILAVKPWSYPVYLLIMALESFLKFQDWRHFSNLFTFPMFIATMFFNVALVGYFLIPAVRAAYFNKRLRWWESKPRYAVDIKGRIEQDGNERECSILNLSEGGALIRISEPIAPEPPFRIHFEIVDFNVTVAAKVVYEQKNEQVTCGLQYLHDNATEKTIKRVVRALKKLGYQPRTVIPIWWESLRDWAIRVIKTGKGIVPELPPQR